VSFEDLSSQHSRSEETIENLEAEIERVKVLNERLENDLMQVNKGEERSGGAGQGLAGLEIGKVVSDEGFAGEKNEAQVGTRRDALPQPPSQAMATRRSCPSLPVSGTASVNATPSSKR
jgi:hypothetical protein